MIDKPAGLSGNKQNDRMTRGRPPKIVVVGAASSSFSGLLADIVSCGEIEGAELALVDIDADGLDIMIRLGRRMADEWNRNITVVGSTDRTKILAGADFVLTTIAVGGMATWRQDESIPRKHGYYGHSVDTVGPGGLFRGLRLIPPLIDVCRDVERLAPLAWVINYSNPMAAVCKAIADTSRVNVVGLCTAGYLPGQIARLLDIDEQRIEVVSAGVNHCVWAMRVFVDGLDITTDIHEKIRLSHKGKYYGSSVELLDLFGVWPMPGANHVAEFFPYFYGPGADGREAADKYPFRSGHDFDAELKQAVEQREKLAQQASGDVPLGHQPLESGREAVRMLVSIWTGRRTRHYANIANSGLVDNLPSGTVIEAPVIADWAGIRGLHVGPLPDSVAGLVAARCAYNDLLAKAAVTRSKRVALQCLMADPLTVSIPDARACVDEMFAAQAEFLQEYN